MFIAMRLRDACPVGGGIGAACTALFLITCSSAFAPAPATAATAISREAFFDDLDQHDHTRWEISSGWSNGRGYGCSWRADRVIFDDGRMDLVLDEGRGRDHDLSCGEYRTHEGYGYGRFEVSMKAARGSGVISAFFIYTGPPFGDPWHETTVEILGRDTTQVQFTYFIDGVPTSTTVDLGFDAAEGFHTYAIDWQPDSISWYIDGKLAHVDEAGAQPIPSAPGRIFAHLWNGQGLEDWTGEFEWGGEPYDAGYDWVRYTPWPAAE
jgi:endo-1,3-1,4-beta-glycanase ExoK